MAEYLILIYSDESAWAAAYADELEARRAAHGRFISQIPELGATMLGGNALQDSATATSIRNDIVTDGPSVESKEVLGGYYLIEADDLDHALSVAKLCPAERGGVEVRPIWDLSM